MKRLVHKYDLEKVIFNLIAFLKEAGIKQMSH